MTDEYKEEAEKLSRKIFDLIQSNEALIQENTTLNIKINGMINIS